MRRTLAAFGTGAILALVLMGSSGQPRGDGPPTTKLPPAIGAIHPRLSPDGSSLAFSSRGQVVRVPLESHVGVCYSRRPVIPTTEGTGVER